MERKPILCLDFDGVLHAYTSGWQGLEEIPDSPVEGAMEFLMSASAFFQLAVYSSRSSSVLGIRAMQDWLMEALRKHLCKAGSEEASAAQTAMDLVFGTIDWPMDKPPAFLTIDDRAVTFKGVWPDLQELLAFKPWTQLSDEDDQLRRDNYQEANLKE